jgi:hypothetical protein
MEVDYGNSAMNDVMTVLFINIRATKGIHSSSSSGFGGTSVSLTAISIQELSVLYKDLIPSNSIGSNDSKSIILEVEM